MEQSRNNLVILMCITCQSNLTKQTLLQFLSDTKIYGTKQEQFCRMLNFLFKKYKGNVSLTKQCWKRFSRNSLYWRARWSSSSWRQVPALIFKQQRYPQRIEGAVVNLYIKPSHILAPEQYPETNIEQELSVFYTTIVSQLRWIL